MLDFGMVHTFLVCHLSISDFAALHFEARTKLFCSRDFDASRPAFLIDDDILPLVCTRGGVYLILVGFGFHATLEYQLRSIPIENQEVDNVINTGPTTIGRPVSARLRSAIPVDHVDISLDPSVGELAWQLMRYYVGLNLRFTAYISGDAPLQCQTERLGG
jgi:hypothetical protein